MWDFWKKFSQGRHGLRNISLVAALVFVASFVYANIFSTPVFAASATRNNTTIEYQGHTFSPIGNASSETSARNLPDGTHIYEYEPNSTTREVIAFTASADPLTATSATYLTFSYSPPDSYTRTGNITDISVEGTGTDDPTAGDGTTGSSCNVSFGIGWFICPISNFIAASADKLYEQLSQFLVVQPLRSSTDTPMYRLWVIMRDIANIAFIIVALLIIYSQITGMGINTYGLKKAFPRLVVGIVVVNISYWICALAVDVSNYLGFQLQGMFNNVASTIGDKDFEALNQITWANLTSAILTGGAVTAGVIVGINAIAATTLAGAIPFLIPALVGVLLAILVALVILAARQALITVLVILSPLALLAYVLPSTEKYFEKWKDLFMTMMFMFPIFSVLFGGSHLAGMAILASGKDANNINIIILGLAVQAIPFILTPLIVKFSGSLLGKIAGMINNPKKGVLDRTKNWAKERSDIQRGHILAGHGRNSAINNWSRRKAVKKRDMKNRLESYNKRFEANADTSKDAKEIDTYNRDTDLMQQETKAALDKEWQEKIRTDKVLLERSMELRLTLDDVKLETGKLDTIYENARAGRATGGLSGHTMRRIQDTSESIALTSMAKSMAEYKQRSNEAEVLLNEELSNGARTIDGKSLRDYAGGILDTDEEGRNKALAYAVATKRGQFAKSVQEATELRKHFNPSTEQLQDLITGKQEVVVGTDSSGRTYSFKRSNVYAMEDAIENNVTIGTAPMVDEIISMSGSGLAEYRTSISSALAKAGHTGRSGYQGGSLINEIAKGNIRSRDDLLKHVQGEIAKGKFNEAGLAQWQEGALKTWLEAALHDPMLTGDDLAKLERNIRNLGLRADNALTGENTKDKISENSEAILKDMVKKLK